MIGKDIVRFHAVYWPAFLMSAGVAVPRRIFSHGFPCNRGEKMSKSVGNVIDPFALAKAYGVDPLRYFFLREVPFGQDGNYSHEAIVNRINADLANDLGIATYSGGMRRRLDLAMSLVTTPEVVFLDEPTTGLDPRSRRDVWAAVTELAGGGTTVLLTTQYLEEADQLADRIAVVDDGRVIAEGTADEVKDLAGGASLEEAFLTLTERT